MEASGTAEARRPPHVAMLVTPGMGHLIPLAELAKRLAARHGVTATLITFASTASATQRALLASLPPAIASLSLPPVDLSDLAPGATIETLMCEECARLVPALTGVLSGLRETTRLVAYVADLFGADSFDAAVAAGVPRRYLFYPGNLHGLTIMLHLPELDVSMLGEFRDLAEPLRLPGCVPIPGPDIMSGLQDKSNPCYRRMVHHARLYRESEAILVNSFDGVEQDAARVLSHPEPGRSGWTRSGPVWSRSEPSFGPAASGPDRTGPSIMAVLIPGTGPAAAKPGPDRSDRPTTTGGDLHGCSGEACDVRGCFGEVGGMRERRWQGGRRVRWAARVLSLNLHIFFH